MSSLDSILRYATAITIVGVPVLTLGTNLFIASLVEIDRDGETGRTVGKRAARCMLDSILGGWAALLLMNHPFFAEYELNVLGLSIVGGALTFSMPWWRKKLPPFLSLLWESVKNGVLNWLANLIPKKFDVQQRSDAAAAPERETPP